MQRARRELVFWGQVWRAAPAAVAAAIALVLLGAVAAYGVMVGSARLVETLVQGGDRAWTWLTVTLICLVAQPAASILIGAASAVNQAGVTARCQDLIARAALAPHGIAHLESPESAARLRGAAEHVRDSMQLDAVSSLWHWLSVRVRGVAALVVVGHWSWIAALLVAAAQIANARTMTRYLETVQGDLLDNVATDGRRAGYLWGLLLGPRSGKEVRLFGLTDWALGRYAAVWSTAQAGVLQRRNHAARPVYGSSVVLTAVTVAALIWLALDARGGGLEVATMVAAAQGVAGLQAFGNLGDTQVQVMRVRSSLLSAHDLGGSLPEPAFAEGAPPGEPQAATVSFEDVTFTYPSRDEPVLRDLDLRIPAGQSVALVGVNGVGKSTLIKLLCGLYPPGCGRVRVDGADPAEDDAARRQVAVIFQDFTRYQLSLQDNVGLPLAARGTDPGIVAETSARALHDAAGDDVLARVGDWDTVLDSGYPGGTDLSGGQWQRVALARAFAAVEAGAGVLVLDEPTAALDVRAEAQIFDRFLEVTRGVTSILVSHRLSSVRHAERIVVLGPGGILQDGSHDELLTAGGPYAEMFRLQAARFAAESAGGTPPEIADEEAARA